MPDHSADADPYFACVAGLEIGSARSGQTAPVRSL